MGQKSIDQDGLSVLKAYSWPGNVRELENLVRRIAALYTDDIIGSDIIRQEFEQNRTEPASHHMGDENLSTSVERHLSAYFSAHRDGLPSPRSLRPYIAGNRTPAHIVDIVGHLGQPAAGRESTGVKS